MKEEIKMKDFEMHEPDILVHVNNLWDAEFNDRYGIYDVVTEISYKNTYLDTLIWQPVFDEDLNVLSWGSGGQDGHDRSDFEKIIASFESWGFDETIEDYQRFRNDELHGRCWADWESVEEFIKGDIDFVGLLDEENGLLNLINFLYEVDETIKEKIRKETKFIVSKIQ